MCFRGAGLFRYWTLYNLPLFLLATPMLLVMFRSYAWTLYGAFSKDDCNDQNSATRNAHNQLARTTPVLRCVALPQVVLAILAFTTYHVQIVTRLSSGYPVWYWWLASLMMRGHKSSVIGRNISTANLIVRWMVLYAVIQGGLFATFLPPA